MFDFVFVIDLCRSNNVRLIDAQENMVGVLFACMVCAWRKRIFVCFGLLLLEYNTCMLGVVVWEVDLLEMNRLESCRRPRPFKWLKTLNLIWYVFLYRLLLK